MTLIIQADHVSPTSAAIFWRDAELLRTDIAATVSDYPNATNILAYRVLLRDWPSTEDFPVTRPVVPTGE
jgi:hypothetical protein